MIDTLHDIYGDDATKYYGEEISKTIIELQDSERNIIECYSNDKNLKCWV